MSANVHECSLSSTDEIKAVEEDEDFSDDSNVGSDDDSHTNILQKIEKIKKKKQELIQRLELHKIASELQSSLQRRKFGLGIKRKFDKKHGSSFPKRKSLRLLKIDAAANTDEPLEMVEEEEILNKRFESGEHSLKDVVSNQDGIGNDDLDNIQSEQKNQFLDDISHSFKTFTKTYDPGVHVQVSSFPSTLKSAKKIGCIHRKVVDNRIYTMDIHKSSDFLLIAAGTKNGEIGLWQSNGRCAEDNGAGQVCTFSTYARTISNLVFPQSKPHHLYFSSYAGAVRSIDLNKLVYNQALLDDEAFDISTFALQNKTSDVVIAGCYNGDIVICDSRVKRSLTPYNAHNRCVKSISIHPAQNHYFSTSSNDCLVKIFDFRCLSKKFKHLSQLTEHSRTVESAFFSPITGDKLLTTSLDDLLRVYNSTDVAHPSMTSSVAHNNNTGRWLSNFRAIWHPSCEDIIAIGSMVRPVRQIDFFDSNLDKINVLTDEDHLTTICSIVAFHPTRHVIAGGNSSGKVYIFDYSSSDQ